MICPNSVRVHIYAGNQQAQALRIPELMGEPRKHLVLLEGALHEQTESDAIHVHYLPASCPCCLSFLPFKVTLLRLVRQYQPTDLWIGLRLEQHQHILADLLRQEPHFNFLSW